MATMVCTNDPCPEQGVPKDIPDDAAAAVVCGGFDIAQGFVCGQPLAPAAPAGEPKPATS